MKTFLIIYFLTLPNGETIEAVGESLRASSLEACEQVAGACAEKLGSYIAAAAEDGEGLLFTAVSARCALIPAHSPLIESHD